MKFEKGINGHRRESPPASEIVVVRKSWDNIMADLHEQLEETTPESSPGKEIMIVPSTKPGILPYTSPKEGAPEKVQAVELAIRKAVRKTSGTIADLAKTGIEESVRSYHRRNLPLTPQEEKALHENREKLERTIRIHEARGGNGFFKGVDRTIGIGAVVNKMDALSNKDFSSAQRGKIESGSVLSLIGSTTAVTTDRPLLALGAAAVGALGLGLAGRGANEVRVKRAYNRVGKDIQKNEIKKVTIADTLASLAEKEYLLQQAADATENPNKQRKYMKKAVKIQGRMNHIKKSYDKRRR